MKTWMNVELPKGNSADKFREYCRDMHIKYEPSEADGYIHFEVYVSTEEAHKANAFIEKRC